MALPGSRWRIRSLMVLVGICALAAAYARYRHDMEPVERYRRVLRSPDPVDRGQALRGLRRLGPVALAAEPEMLRVALQDTSPVLRHEATFALLQVGSASPGLVRALVDDLGRRGVETRGYSVAANPLYRVFDPAFELTRLHPPLDVLVPALAEAYADESFRYARPAIVHQLCNAVEGRPAVPREGIDVLLDALDPARLNDGEEVARTLATLGPTVRVRAVARLIERIKGGPANVSIPAAGLLSRFSPEATEAVDWLVGRLESEVDETKVSALLALGLIGDEARKAVPAILRVMADRSAGRQTWESFRVVPSPRPSADELRDLLSAPDWSQARELAARAGAPTLRSVGALALDLLGREAQRQAVSMLIRRLRDRDVAARRGAILALGAIGTPAARAVPDLLALLPTTDDPRRGLGRAFDKELPEAAHVASALVDIRMIDSAVLDALATLLRGPDAAARDHAAYLAGRLGPAAADATTPALLALLDGPDPRGREVAARALGQVHAQGWQVEPALRKALQDDRDAVRIAAAGSLGELGSEAAPEVARAMIDLLRAPEPATRGLAAGALRTLHRASEPAIPALLEAIDDVAEVRDAAQSALEEYAPATRRGGPWHHALSDGTMPIRRQAASVIGRLRLDDPPTISALVEALDDRDAPLRAIAAAALGRIGPPAEGATAALSFRLATDEPAVRPAAAVALAKVAPHDPDVRASLRRALADPAPDVRRAAASALAALGPDAADCLDSLRPLLADDSPRVRQAAERALKAIAPASRGSRAP